MKFLIVGLVENDQLTRLKEEGQKLGHEVNGCYAAELTIRAGRNNFDPTLRGNPIDYDLIYLWTVGMRRWEWYTAAYVLNQIKGTKIVNRKIIEPDYLYYLSPAMEYYKQFRNNLPFPASAIIFDSKSVDSIIENFQFPLIVKTSAGRQGKGVFKVESIEELKNKIKDLKNISPSFVIREFIPNDGDVRVFTVGYKAIAAMKRIPTKEGEFRSNISQGGRGEKFDLENNSEIKSLAEKLSELTRTEIAGVDIMIHKETGQPYILEINPGPQFTGLEKYTGVNAAQEIIKYFQTLCK
jgi:RimK family alpha-L-glutamate ligase